LRLNIEYKISFIATFIALLALIFSILDHCQNRKHNKETVKPILLIEEQEFDNKYGIFLSNQGYGPAIIDSCLVFYNNKRIKQKNVWKEIFNIHYLTPIDFVIEKKTLSGGHVIKTGENQLIWGSSVDELGGNKQLLKSSIENIHIKLYYHSIYEDKFVVSFQ
jgi:hypothetical protein